MYKVTAKLDKGYAIPKYSVKCPRATGPGHYCWHDTEVTRETKSVTCKCNAEIEVEHAPESEPLVDLGSFAEYADDAPDSSDAN